MNDQPTPETDAAEMTAAIIAVNLPPESSRFVHADFARKLEREKRQAELLNISFHMGIRKLERERDELREAIRETLMENLHLADGDVCTLKKIRDAIQFQLP